MENFFSILMEDGSTPFFKSSRGLRQEDPLSPSLFVLAEEVLSRGVMKLLSNRMVMPYFVSQKCPVISHSLFADDTIIFLNGRKSSIICMMNFLKRYQEASGQKINCNKSSFLVLEKCPIGRRVMLNRITGVSRGSLPFTYLECPIFKGIYKQIYFEDLVRKIQSKIARWYSRLLSPGGRLILIKHVVTTLVVTPNLTTFFFFKYQY